MTFAPTYLAGLVVVLMGAQSLLGLDFTSDQWTAAIMVASGLFVAVRQWLTGKATWFGSRP